jgi:peptide chain release factor
VRPHHKRKNWFFGVVALPEQAVAPRLRETDVRFDTLRAGGPGGQHQNKTESAVRATHVPTGVTVVAREERSQQRNKALALQRLADLASLAADATARAAAERVHASHDAVQRGRPVRTFTGPWFVER